MFHRAAKFTPAKARREREKKYIETIKEKALARTEKQTRRSAKRGEKIRRRPTDDDDDDGTDTKDCGGANENYNLGLMCQDRRNRTSKFLSWSTHTHRNNTSREVERTKKKKSFGRNFQRKMFKWFKNLFFEKQKKRHYKHGRNWIRKVEKEGTDMVVITQVIRFSYLFLNIWSTQGEWKR